MNVITGSMPCVGEIRTDKRESDPDLMWSAYCRPSYSANIPSSERLFSPVGRNECASNEEIIPHDTQAKASLGGDVVTEMPVKELEGRMKKS